MTERLPDFLVLGGMRCGSTTLYNVLSKHPQVFMPKQKELHFFDGYNPDIADDLIAYKQLFKESEEKQLCGEVTPDYLTTPGAFERISETFNELKVVVILREPVARLCSHYMMSLAAGFEVLSFGEAIDIEQKRMSCRDKIADIFHSYRERSTYLPQLKKYAERFGQENLHIVIMEEFDANPEKELSDLWGFLRVERIGLSQLGDAVHASNKHKDMFAKKQENLSWFEKIKNVLLKQNNNLEAKVSEKQKQDLRKEFEQHNQDLAGWLNRKLPW